MLKSLYPQIDWDTIRIVGYDMDGTLYDEAEFIYQVYRHIAGLITSNDATKCGPLHDWMFRRWLEKGSSYQNIFREAVERSETFPMEISTVITRCLKIFRNHKPTISLTPRAKAILDLMYMRYPLFLVSDGTARLQQTKFDALGLSCWFEKHNVALTGYYGPEYCKPKLRILKKIKILNYKYQPHQVVYFGDRQIDEEFANNAGFQFLRVSALHPVQSS